MWHGNIQDEPTHIEYLRMKDGDTRRDKRRCKYYTKENCYCSRRCCKCIGSTYCSHYTEKAKKIENDEPYWYTNSSAPKHTESKLLSVKLVPMSNSKLLYLLPIEAIEVPKHYIKAKPNSRKVELIIEHIKNDKSNTIDKPIPVIKNDTKFVLQDSYSRYCAAKEYGLKEVPVVLCSKEKFKEKDFCKTGMRVIHKVNGLGTVMDFNIINATIKFDKKFKPAEYNIEACILNGLITKEK